MSDNTKRGRRQRKRGVGTPTNRRSERSVPTPHPLGDSTTRYTNDPFGGDKQAHAIAKKLKQGWPARKVAKHLNLPLATVEEIRQRQGKVG